MSKDIYTVVVGNIGMVLETNQHSAAVRCFQDYVILSSDHFGRSAGEDVTMLRDDEILLAYTGDITDLG